MARAVLTEEYALLFLPDDPIKAGRIEGKIRMFDWGKSSGLDIIAEKNLAFFAPPRPPKIGFASPAGSESTFTKPDFKIIVRPTRQQRNG